MALLDDIKLALSVTHTKKDSDIQDTIDAAKEEMIRVGISSDLVNADPLGANLKKAIIAYCFWQYSMDPTLADGYQKSFYGRLDNLRKSASYNGGDSNGT